MTWLARPLDNPDSQEVKDAMTRECPVCKAPPDEGCRQPIYAGVVHRERAYPYSIGVAQ